MKALVIDAETWPDDINANLQYLKYDVGQFINKSIGFENYVRKNQNGIRKNKC
jgi:hypothetical protein